MSGIEIILWRENNNFLKMKQYLLIF